MKLYIITDMEGVAGIVSWDSHKGLEPKKEEWMTLEVQAAIEGAKAAGADEIIVLESHKLLIDLLDKDVKIVVSGAYSLAYLSGLDSSVDAVLIIGQHARAGVQNGVLNHTGNSSIMNIYLNGEAVGEAGFAMAYAASFGVPTIFLSGDTAAVAEAKELVKNIAAVAVKEGIEKFKAISLHPRKARELIKEGVARAVPRVGEIDMFKPAPPYELKIEFATTQTASKMALIPGVKQIDARTVAYSSDNFKDIAVMYCLRGALFAAE